VHEQFGEQKAMGCDPTDRFRPMLDCHLTWSMPGLFLLCSRPWLLATADEGSLELAPASRDGLLVHLRPRPEQRLCATTARRKERHVKGERGNERWLRRPDNCHATYRIRPCSRSRFRKDVLLVSGWAERGCVIADTSSFAASGTDCRLLRIVLCVMANNARDLHD